MCAIEAQLLSPPLRGRRVLLSSSRRERSSESFASSEAKRGRKRILANDQEPNTSQAHRSLHSASSYVEDIYGVLVYISTFLDLLAPRNENDTKRSPLMYRFVHGWMDLKTIVETSGVRKLRYC